MPQEKFITRKEAGLRDIEGGARTVSKAGRKASGKAFDKVYQPATRAYDRAIAYSDGMVHERPIPTKALIDSAVVAKKASMDRRTAFDDANEKGRQAEAKKTSKVVTQRDATNARVGRERLSGRASAAKATPKGGGMSGAMSNPMIGVAASMYEADRATDFKRTKYSGNFGGPSFSSNPYARSNSNYAGQSPMSKMMGVKK